ncbi:interferon-induced protein with tetratricopeptide repeats 1-like [Kryptolebias marmoratus]|uniref:Interferon-induced protein with tetratricopeptide repeats 1-like n=1 Tax=Kryptolebias marmoratus TaxID=37003 RepID=A0A3Q3ABQ5_KRYMA|nr:interferon-induced protein with tetratricopeptide repeats 1-like [Kryptolebias marmoratus]
MMSAAESLESKLEALQSHFTWDLDPRRSKLFRLKDNLEDIGTEEDNIWLGPIYNLQGFIHYKLGFMEEARAFFSRATEAFQQLKTTDEGPWLVVNYGNLAWLHHHTGEDEKSQDFLSKVDALMNKYPAPIKGELHLEVCAEKAWTLMKFDNEKKLQAAEYFQKAIRMEPNTVLWQTSRVLALVSASKHSDSGLDDDIWEDMRVARMEDPKNLYLAAVELKESARRGEQIRDEAQELAEKILLNPVSSYRGLKPLLRSYRQIDAFHEAIDLAERALNEHPDSRYLKRCAALCYKWKIIFSKDRRPNERMISRAIGLYEEVISLYPQSSLVKQLDLANIQAKSGQGLMKSDQTYKKLLREVQDPADKQMIYNSYAKYLNFERQERNKSVEYHMKATAINHQSFFRQNSIKALEKIRDRGRNRMCREITEFLEKLEILQKVNRQ